VGIHEGTLYDIPFRVFFFALIAIANARATGKRKYKHEASKYILRNAALGSEKGCQSSSQINDSGGRTRNAGKQGW
jgi:hypothetical protein